MLSILFCTSSENCHRRFLFYQHKHRDQHVCIASGGAMQSRGSTIIFLVINCISEKIYGMKLLKLSSLLIFFFSLSLLHFWIRGTTHVTVLHCPLIASCMPPSYFLALVTCCNVLPYSVIDLLIQRRNAWQEKKYERGGESVGPVGWLILLHPDIGHPAPRGGQGVRADRPRQGLTTH